MGVSLIDKSVPAKATFVASVTVSDTRRKARGRFKMYDDDDDEETLP